MTTVTGDLTANAIIESLRFADDFDRTVAAGLGPDYTHWSGTLNAASVNGSYALIGPGTYEIFTAPFELGTTDFTLQYDFWVSDEAYQAAAPSGWSNYYWVASGSFGSDLYAIDIPGPTMDFEVEVWTGDGTQFGGNWVTATVTLETGAWHRYKARRGGGLYQIKMWKVGSPEPDWQLVTETGSLEWSRWSSMVELDGAGGTGSGGESRIDNFRIWAPEPVIVIRSGFLSASAILAKTVSIPIASTGSVDTFTDAQAVINLFEHIPDSGPMWSSEGVVAFNGVWWAYSGGYSVLETNQHDYDLSFDYYGYGQIRVDLRRGSQDAVCFFIGQTQPPGAFGYALITEMVDGSVSWSPNRSGFTLNQWYSIRIVLSDNFAEIYVDGVLADSYTVVGDHPSTAIRVSNLTGAGTVLDNWNFPYQLSGTGFSASAIVRIKSVISRSFGAGSVIWDPTTRSSFSASAVLLTAPLPAVNEIVIRINGVDVTDDVLFNDAEFMSQASGSPGTCRFRLKDMNRAYDIVVGQTLRLEINGKNIWGGWVQSVKRQFFFPYTASGAAQPRRLGHVRSDPCDGVEPMAIVPRALVIEGIDYNILFNKRYVFNKAKPADSLIKTWPAETHDDVEIRWLCEHDLDLSGDGLDVTTKVEYVGSPNPDERGNPAGPGWKWGDAMRAIARYPGAVFYINPDKQLVYTDVNEPDAGYRLTDVPTDPFDLGYRDMELLYNGSNLVNDAMVWGAGQGARRVRFQRTRDQASIDAHGLWQVGDFRGDLWRQESVDKRSRSFVYGSPQNKRGGKDDAVSVAVTLFEPAFRVAQKVDFWSHVFDFHDVLPVRRMRVTFPTTKEAQFDLVLSHAIDEPWNTFEYWFPPIPKPRVVVDTNTTISNCPVPNLPSLVDGASLASFVPVFSDDFSRESGQPYYGQYGSWINYQTGEPADPVILPDHTVELGPDPYKSLNAVFASPISGSVQIIIALDMTGWAPRYYYTYDYINVEDVTRQMRFLSINDKGQVLLPFSLAYEQIDPALFIGKKVFIRVAIYKNYYTGFRIWPQDELEPFEWTLTGDGLPGYGGSSYQEGGIVVRGVSLIAQWNDTKLMGITVFGDTSSQSNLNGAVGGFNLDNNGWVKTWGYQDPQDGYVYAVTWGEETLTRANTSYPNYSYGIVWGYYAPGAGWPNGASQSISSISTGNTTLPNGSTVSGVTSPRAIRVKGKVGVSLGRTRGLDSRGNYPGATNVTIEFRTGSSPTAFFVDGDDPYWLGMVALYMTLGLIWDDPVVWQDFDFTVSVLAEAAHAGTFQWGVNVQKPLDTCRKMDSRGGPFMLPNGGGVNIRTDKIELLGIWDTIGGPAHFCVTTGVNGATADSHVCESVPIDSIALHELYKTGTMWAVQLQNPYQPGTVEVTVDGLPAKPALDFIETNPSTGVITFLNSFLGAKVITVCYFPMDNDVVEPTPPYVPPGGGSQPW